MRQKIRQIRRIRLLVKLLIIIMVILGIRLAILTIAKGDYYSEISENLSVKDVYTTAPRGEIKDRNGVVLAGNKPSFSLQIIKEEFYELDQDEKNSLMSKCIKILEKDAITYKDNFPIDLNVFTYANTSDYLSTSSGPLDQIVDIIIDKNLLGDIISLYYSHDSIEGTYYYFPIENILNSLEAASIDAPFVYTYENGRVNIDFDKDRNIDRWKRENSIGFSLNAKNSLLKLIDNDEIIIRKLLGHPVSRRLAYDIIKDKGLAKDIVLDPVSIRYVEEYESIKRSFMEVYPRINMDTSAKQDFIIIFEENSLIDFISSNHENQELSTKETMEQILEDQDIKDKIQINESDGKLTYLNKENNENIDYEEMASFISKEKKTEDLLEIGNNVSIAQSLMVDKGINTNITIVDGFDYQAIRELNNLYERYNIDKDSSDEEILDQIREYYKIGSKISDYEFIGIANIYEELNTRSELAYMPVIFSYDLKESTVAQVEEKLYDFDGFNISNEPIRYYPHGKTAAHVLGYMGKISQPKELSEYVDEKDYNPETVIGKTGIEESFEDNLYGKDGYKKVEVDSLGNRSDVNEEIKPIPGDNIYLTLDYKLQKRTEEALENTLRAIRAGSTIESPWGDFNVVRKSNGSPYSQANSGAVVVSDVKTGEVLALASYPSYDPNLFSTGISSADWQSLMPENKSDPLAPRPLYNVATQTAIQPGSAFKMITAITALEKGLDPDTKITCDGYVDVGNTRFGCWIYNQHGGAHGPLDLSQAIEVSCNNYFYSLALGQNGRSGKKLPVKVEIEEINETAKKFGLGSDSGLEINVPKESALGRPDPEKKLELSKSILKNWLNENLEDYYVGDSRLTSELKESIIDEIVSLLDLEEAPTLEEVYKILEELGLDGGKKIKNSRESLADYIKFTFINDSKWNIADTINITIGQGENQYTLTQMIKYVATIANNGVRNKLTLINNIKDYNNDQTIFSNNVVSEDLELKNMEGLKAVQEGMHKASLSGYNAPVFSDFPVEIALKTGTAERSGINPNTNQEYDPFAYEVAYAPYDDPEIAIGVVLFQGGSGANCSPIIREIVAEYMGLYKDNQEDNLPIELDIVS